MSVGDPVLTTLVSSDKVYAYFDASEATFLKYMRAAKPADGLAERPSGEDMAEAERLQGVEHHQVEVARDAAVLEGVVEDEEGEEEVFEPEPEEK